jgi:hypothetical protein
MDIHSQTHFRKKYQEPLGLHFRMSGILRHHRQILEIVQRIAFNQLQLECWALAGTKVRWQHISPGERLHNRCKEWFEASSVTVANNKHDNSTGTHQYGGTVITTCSLSHRISSKGQY